MKKYIEDKLTLSDTTTEDQLFAFGADYGNGTDDYHFHCGFTSIKLLRLLEEINTNSVLFHLDCTYKIVKYNCPLIDNFFNSLSQLLLTFNNYFEQIYKNTCIDASQAMSNSIKKNYPMCKILMCYFHFKSNIKNQKCHQIGRIPKSEYFTIME